MNWLDIRIILCGERIDEKPYTLANMHNDPPTHAERREIKRDSEQSLLKKHVSKMNKK